MIAWLRSNLFRSVGDGITTVVVGSALAYLGYRFLRFLFVTGRWDVVRENLSLYLTGSWPDDQLWRLAAVIVGFAAVAGLASGAAARRARAAAVRVDADVRSTPARLADLAERLWPAVVTVLLLLSLARTVGPWLLAGATVATVVVANQIGRRLPLRAGPSTSLAVPVAVVLGLWFLDAGVDWNSWGGLLFNLALAAISITLCFPIGVVLAIGRQSTYPILRLLSTAYIELFRGCRWWPCCCCRPRPWVSSCPRT